MNHAGARLPEYNLEDRVKPFTIHVGSACACRSSQDLVMVAGGGVGVLALKCCGMPMERLNPCPASEKTGDADNDGAA